MDALVTNSTMVFEAPHRPRRRRSGALIRTPFPRALLSAVRLAGLDERELAARHGLGADAGERPEVRVPLETLRALGDDAAAVLGAPDLAIHLAAGIDRGQFGLFEYLLRSAATLREGCELATRYVRLVNELTQVSFSVRGGEALIDERIPGEPLGGGRQANEFVLAAIVRLIREGFRADWRPSRVWFAHPGPADRSGLAEYFGTEALRFATGSNGLAFPVAELGLPVRSAEPALLSVLEAHARAIVASPLTSGGTTAQARELVRISLRHGAPRLEQIAAGVGLTARGLQRHLVAEGTSFNALVDEVRSALARLYVAEPSVSLSECAFLLGYADPRAFLRAFRRWTGTTPTAFRRAS
jgi:AraC-like DNA-binding protein